MKRGASANPQEDLSDKQSGANDSQVIKKRRQEPLAGSAPVNTASTDATPPQPSLSPLFCDEELDFDALFDGDNAEPVATASSSMAQEQKPLSNKTENKPTPPSPMSKALQQAKKHGISVPDNVRDMYEPEEVLRHITPILDYRRKLNESTNGKREVAMNKKACKRNITKLAHNGKRPRSKSFMIRKLGM